jgi:hypothetical protein
MRTKVHEVCRGIGAEVHATAASGYATNRYWSVCARRSSKVRLHAWICRRKKATDKRFGGLRVVLIGRYHEQPRERHLGSSLARSMFSCKCLPQDNTSPPARSVSRTSSGVHHYVLGSDGGQQKCSGIVISNFLLSEPWHITRIVLSWSQAG